MVDVITLGSATRDIFLNVDFLQKKGRSLVMEPGRKFEIAAPVVETGGGATNVAVGLARLGVKVAVVTEVGNDEAGRVVRQNLQRERVETRFVRTDPNLGTALAFILWKRGVDRTVFIYRGASADVQVRASEVTTWKTKWLYVSALSGKAVRSLRDVMRAAKKHGMNVALNPGAQELRMPGLLHYADVVLVNREEAEVLSGVKGNVRQVLRKIAAKGPSTIVVTDGPRKIHAWHHGQMYHTTPFDVQIMNTLGAGDAFASGCVAGLVRNEAFAECLRWGCLNAASIVMHSGAKERLLHRKDLGSFARSLRQAFKVGDDAAG